MDYYFTKRQAYIQNFLENRIQYLGFRQRQATVVMTCFSVLALLALIIK